MLKLFLYPCTPGSMHTDSNTPFFQTITKLCPYSLLELIKYARSLKRFDLLNLSKKRSALRHFTFHGLSELLFVFSFCSFQVRTVVTITQIIDITVPAVSVIVWISSPAVIYSLSPCMSSAFILYCFSQRTATSNTVTTYKYERIPVRES